MIRQPIPVFFVLLGVLLASSCASIPTSRPIAPTVKIQSVKPIKLSLRKQELAFQLNVFNPNSYDVPLKSLSFIAGLDGEEIAQGVSNVRVTLPAKGNASLAVTVTTRISRILPKLLLLAHDSSESASYNIKGFIKLSNWPIRIPFSTEGVVDGTKLK